MSGLFEEYELDLGKETRWHIVSATVAAKSSFLYMQECGHYIAGPGYYTGREGFDSFLMMLTLSGGGEVDYDGKLWKLSPGSICWLDCRKRMKYFTDPSTASWDFLWVHFYGGNVRALYEHFLKRNNNRPETHPENVLAIRNSLQDLIELDNSGIHQFENDVRTQDILTRILSQCILDVMDSHSSEDIPKIVTDIQAYIQLNYTGTARSSFWESIST
ncbi:MAG: AraC family ligand binding domain-containing protein [Lachnospiraceae bacterium]|nr:AraC family ligand binding domain-containing protein [Lachnospiraceae bacterium]